EAGRYQRRRAAHRWGVCPGRQRRHHQARLPLPAPPCPVRHHHRQQRADRTPRRRLRSRLPLRRQARLRRAHRTRHAERDRQFLTSSPQWPAARGRSLRPSPGRAHVPVLLRPWPDRAHSTAWAAGVRSAADRGAMGPELAGREYGGQLTDADLRLLASVAAGRAGTGPPADGSWLRGDPAALLAVLEHPGTFDAVIGQDEAAAGWTGLASPFLVFAVFVQRAATELAAAGHVPERTGPRQRVPLFDAGALREVLAEPERRLFLAELLASFTRVASGRYRSRVGGRLRTRRFSELDPVRLAGLLEAVPRAERPGVYRRLGDVTLFLTGVFPD